MSRGILCGGRLGVDAVTRCDAPSLVGSDKIIRRKLDTPTRGGAQKDGMISGRDAVALRPFVNDSEGNRVIICMDIFGQSRPAWPKIDDVANRESAVHASP